MQEKFDQSQAEIKEKSELLASCQEKLSMGNKQVFFVSLENEIWLIKIETQLNQYKSRIQTLEGMQGQTTQKKPSAEAQTRIQDLEEALQGLNSQYQALLQKHQSLLKEVYL